MTREERKDLKIAMGWSPLEADELLDVEDEVIPPSGAVLVGFPASGNPFPHMPLIGGFTTDKQQENLDYLKAQTENEIWKTARMELIQ